MSEPTTASAIVTTEHASRYLQQLAKHWAHKFEVEFTPTHAEIKNDERSVIMDATPSELRVNISTIDPATLEKWEEVVAAHVVRFGFREELAFNWTRG